jgi:post-segregation antitoxin (ccd killing protein)
MDGSRSKTWQTVGAALIVGAIAGAVLFAVHTPSEQRTVAAAGTVVEAAPASAARSGDIAALLEVKPAPVESPPPLADGEVRVCGQTVPRAALAEEQIERTLYEAGAASALEEFALQRLADSDHARAVGLVLRMQADANYRDGPDSYPACQTDECRNRAKQANAERVAPLLNELATLAATSSDARVMMLARDQCYALAGVGPPAPHCQALNARRLVALDRDNAIAWLALAAEEPAATDEAMHQAALARRWDDHATSARQYIERVDAKGGLRSMVITQALLAVPTVRSIEDRRLVTQHCGARQVAADANRHQLCNQLAQGLHERSTNVSSLVTAGIVAKTLANSQAEGWIEQAKLLDHVLLTQSLDDAAQARDARDCAVGMPRELLLRSAREGEVPALRALMQASGQSEAQWRENMLAFEQAQAAGQIKLNAADAAASAASAPR